MGVGKKNEIDASSMISGLNWGQKRRDFPHTRRERRKKNPENFKNN